MFDEDTFNPLENVADPEADTPPVVRFSNSEDPRYGLSFEIDICDTTTARREYVRSQAPGLTLNKDPIMSCEFESNQKDHGRDVCDGVVDASCAYKLDIEAYEELSWFDKILEFFNLKGFGKIAESIHGLDTSKKYEAAAVLEAQCSVNVLFEFPGIRAPNMLCSSSPAYEKACTRKPVSDKYLGGYDSRYRRFGTERYELLFAFPKDVWKALKKGEGSAIELFRLAATSIFWPLTLGRGPEATEALAKHIDKDGAHP
jgi:hypothetical protein